MKRLMTATAIATIFSTAAFASTEMDVRDRVEQQVELVTGGVALVALPEPELRALNVRLNSTESSAEASSIIDALIAEGKIFVTETEVNMDMDMDSMDMDGNSLRAQVDNMLTTRGYDVDVSELDDDQVAGLYVVLTSGSETDASKVEAITN